MDLKNITVTEINNAITVYSEKGRLDRMSNRKYYGLSLCLDGQITYIQNEKEYVSDSNTAVILPKGGSYIIKRDKTGNFPVINFNCSDLLCDTVTVIRIKNRDQLLYDYEIIKKLFCFNGNRAQIFSIFYGMLHKLSADDIPNELRAAIQLIRNNYSDQTITNERLAKECNMSEVYFRKLFSKHIGSSPRQFIIDIRLQRAKQLLSEGVLNISAISEMCGFSNQYHFCRTFKIHTGATPSEFRKEHMIYKI